MLLLHINGLAILQVADDILKGDYTPKGSTRFIESGSFPNAQSGKTRQGLFSDSIFPPWFEPRGLIHAESSPTKHLPLNKFSSSLIKPC